MSPLQYLLTAVPAGLAGFDPAPALIAMAALAARIRRRDIALFGSLLIGGTALWGLILSTLIGDRLTHVAWHALLRGGALPAILEVILGIGLIIFSAVRVWKSRSHPGDSDEADADPEQKEARGLSGLILTAAVFIAIVVFDPPFPLFAALSSPQPPPVQAIGWMLWAALSQVPLTILLCALPVKSLKAVVDFLNRMLARVMPAVKPLVTVSLLGAALVLLVDAGAFFTSGGYAIEFA